MSKDLQLLDSSSINALIAYLPEHAGMLKTIEINLPEITRATSLFGKTQSQFMDNLLTVTHTTPLRNLRQILAQIERCKEALRQQHFKSMKKEVKIKMKQRSLEKEKDPLKAELIEIELMEYSSDIEAGRIYISGAVREMTNYIEQYNSILSSMGKTNFNEIDFESEEEKYHIQKAFEQGVTAARGRPSATIDEGNMIYLTQIGINGAAAQQDVYTYLSQEGKILSEGRQPTHKMFLDFLTQMSDKYRGCSLQYSKYKGMTGQITESAALKTGDLRFLQNPK